ncbi:MAG: transglycosylase SLT domain-containing protein [Streptosporangiales bacterium]|nr:transglycosylase SLT domain-containing protein [Streptosporangiales bacterium]
MVLLPLMILQAFLSGIGGFLGDLGGAGSCTGSQQEPSDQAKNGIPSNYIALYQEAAAKHGINWTILAGIGRVETNHGRLDAPGVTSGTNFAGAAGPMQFLLSTWEAYGVDGNGDGRKNVYDPEDAIPAAAGYLKANGAPDDLYGAIFAYNHAGWYVDMVLDWASRYARGGAVAVAANFGATCVDQALGEVPAGVAGKVISYARAQLGKPYVWGAEGPDVFDCSGLTMMAYRSAGISIPRVTHDQIAFGKRVPEGQEQPGDLVFFRYDSGYIGHVGIVIGGGKMINAPQTGDVVKIASYDDRDNIAGFTRPGARSQV